MEIPNPGDQYNLKWNNHLANFVQTFVEHQHGEFLVDVTLSCEGQYIKTHKLVLSACSDYFHSIFQVHGSLQHPIILLNGVRFSDLKYILHFMYHGEVKVLDKDLPNVLALGETLQIKGLSSVKLRDVPPEQVKQPTANKTSKKNQKKEQNLNDLRSSIPSSIPSLPIRPLPSEVPLIIQTNDKPSFYDYGRHKSPKLVTPNIISTQAEVIPIITSVTSIATSPSAAMIPDSPPKNTNSYSKHEETSTTPNNSTSKRAKNRIPKPPHAFMIFANEWRKKLTIEHPEENNKEISVRLGTMWKNLLPETKNIYYREAQRAEEEHKLKYPNYVSPGDSMKRKADVLNDSTNTSTATTSLDPDPMEIVEIQEEIAISDSD